MTTTKVTKLGCERWNCKHNILTDLSFIWIRSHALVGCRVHMASQHPVAGIFRSKFMYYFRDWILPPGASRLYPFMYTPQGIFSRPKQHLFVIYWACPMLWHHRLPLLAILEICNHGPNSFTIKKLKLNRPPETVEPAKTKRFINSWRRARTRNSSRNY